MWKPRHMEELSAMRKSRGAHWTCLTHAVSVSFVVGLSVQMSVLSVEVTAGHRYILMRM